MMEIGDQRKHERPGQQNGKDKTEDQRIERKRRRKEVGSIFVWPPLFDLSGMSDPTIGSSPRDHNKVGKNPYAFCSLNQLPGRNINTPQHVQGIDV